jgi:hypothetical protein
MLSISKAHNKLYEKYLCNRAAEETIDYSHLLVMLLSIEFVLNAVFQKKYTSKILQNIPKIPRKGMNKKGRFETSV